MLGSFPLARAGQAMAVLLAALASIATSPATTGDFGVGEGGAGNFGEVTLSEGSPSSTVDLTLTELDSLSPVLTITPAFPFDSKLTPDSTYPFPYGFVTVTLLTPNGSTSPGTGIVVPPIGASSSATTFTIPRADAFGRGCMCPATPAPGCEPSPGPDASLADDGGNAQAEASVADDASSTGDASTASTDAGNAGPDAGCAAPVDNGCDYCNAHVRLTFLLPSGFTSLDVGYNLSVAHGTVTSP